MNNIVTKYIQSFNPHINITRTEWDDKNKHYIVYARNSSLRLEYTYSYFGVDGYRSKKFKTFARKYKLERICQI